MSLTWFAVITIVSFLVFICAGQVFYFPPPAPYIAGILFMGACGVIILWAAYLDYKDAAPGRKIAFIIFGLICAAVLFLAHYYPVIAQTLFM
jgi:hypothetical protein